MKNILLLILSISFLISCGNKEQEDKYQTKETSKEESHNSTNQKLINILKSEKGVVDADILDDILTIRGNFDEIEGQKFSEEMLSDMKAVHFDINSVIVLNLKYELMGHSGAKIDPLE